MYTFVHLHPNSLSKQFCTNSQELDYLFRKATHVVYHGYCYKFTDQHLSEYVNGRMNLPIDTQMMLLEQLRVKFPHIEFILGFETTWTLANESGWQHLLQDGAAFAVFCRQLYHLCVRGPWSGYCLPVSSCRSLCPLALTQALPFWTNFSREFKCFLLLPQNFAEEIRWADYQCQIVSENVEGFIIPMYGQRRQHVAEDYNNIHRWQQWLKEQPCLDKSKMVLLMDTMDVVLCPQSRTIRDIIPRSIRQKVDGSCIETIGETRLSVERKKQMVYVHGLLGLALEDPCMDVPPSSPESLWSFMTASSLA